MQPTRIVNETDVIFYASLGRLGNSANKKKLKTNA